MGLRLAFRTNLSAFVAWMVLALVASAFRVERVSATLQLYPLKAVAWSLYFAFFLSLLWLYIHSWVMLARAWKNRTSPDNAKLFLILFFFSFAAAYWFYWKRYEIDSSVP